MSALEASHSFTVGDNRSVKLLCCVHRSSTEILSLAVCLFQRFTLTSRTVKDLVAERGAIAPL